MIKKLLLIMTIVFIMIIPSYADVELTDEEQEWLENHPVIRFGGDPSFPPFDFFDGSQKGLAIDYLKEIEKRTGIRVEFVQLESWDVILNAINKREIDLVIGSYHASREENMSFSSKIIDIPYIIVTRKDYDKKVDISELHNKRVAAIEGWIFVDILLEEHPGIEIVEYPTVADALKAVSFGIEDLYIQDIGSVSYEIEKNKITNLMHNSEYPRSVDLRFVVRKDYEIFRNIIDKVLLDMSSKDKKNIYNKWININIIPFYKQPVYYIVLSLIVSIGVLSFVWFKILHRQIKVKTRELEEELQKSNKIQLQLEEAIEQQKDIQREMILQERMASLGSMVAGISHEVNNPLGVCLTTSSAFKNKLDKLRYAYEHDNLKKNQFIEFIDQSDDTARLIESNLQRAIQTINSFKLMAINQMQDGKEMIDFCAFIRSINDSLKYELKKKNVEVENICSDNIFILGDLGALTQIFTNLILNSLIHGFNNDISQYKIQIKSAIIERVLVVEYRDNGVGIPEDIIDNIFKLFFTTKKTQGGSGIGLHIVRNLLTEKFEGRISCQNHEEGGVMFTLHIPMRNH